MLESVPHKMIADSDKIDVREPMWVKHLFQGMVIKFK
jgi:hypothetical protein